MILGLVAAKEHSKRFPGKNLAFLRGKPLFWHSVEPLILSHKVDDVYVITDSEFIRSYCEHHGVGVIWRPKNATRDEDKLVSVLRFGFYSLNTEYEVVVAIMANCPGHQASDVDRGLELLGTRGLREVRSFDKEGEESGLLIFSKEIMQSNFDISYYMGCLGSNVKEIHCEEDLRVAEAS